MNKQSLPIALLIALIVAGCQTSSFVKTELDPEANLSNYETFAILPLPTEVPGTDTETLLKFSQPAVETTRASLTSKGYTETDISQADFAVSLKGEVIPQTRVTDWGYSPYPQATHFESYQPYAGIGEVEADYYEEGTLIVEIYDHKAKEMAWVGWATVRKQATPNVERFKEVLGRILAEFPSR